MFSLTSKQNFKNYPGDDENVRSLMKMAAEIGALDILSLLYNHFLPHVKVVKWTDRTSLFEIYLASVIASPGNHCFHREELEGFLGDSTFGSFVYGHFSNLR